MDHKEAESALVASVQRFATHAVAPVFSQTAQTPQSLSSLRVEAAKLGLTGIQVPESYGGLALPFSAKSRSCEILARVDLSFAMSIVNTQNVAQKLSVAAADGLRERFIPPLLSGERTACTAITEPSAGSDAAAMRTTARPVNGSWRLEGEKSWIINARHAETVIVYAQTAGIGDGRGVAAFIVDTNRPGVERTHDIAMSDQDAIGVGGFRFDGYLATPDEMLAPPGEAFRAILQEINGARVYVAAMCNGMVAAALDRVIAYGKTRQTFGKPLREHQGWRWPLARASAALAASRHLTAAAEAAVDSGTDAQLLAAQAKIVATEMATQQVPALMQAMGAAGLDSREPFTRFLAGTRIATLADGSTEMLLERVAHLISKDSI